MYVTRLSFADENSPSLTQGDVVSPKGRHHVCSFMFDDALYVFGGIHTVTNNEMGDLMRVSVLFPT
jgi:hypothetical protein